MFLDRLLPRRQSLAAIHGPYALSDSRVGELFGRRSGSGRRVAEEDTLTLSAVFAAVNLLARVIATLPLNVYRRTEIHGRPGRESAVTNPAHWLLRHEANPEMSAAVARRTMEFFAALWGNGYQAISWDRAGKAAALWPIQPWRVAPARDDDGTLFYRIDGRDRIEAADMIHVHQLSLDGVCGKSFVDYACESLGGALAAQDFASYFFGNDATPGGLLVHKGSPNEEARKQMRKAWEEMHQGATKTRKTGVLWGGWEYERDAGSIDPEKAQLIETRRFATEEVARWLNIPPHLLADLSRATFSNIEEQGISFIVYSIGPTLVEREQEFDRKLLTPPDTYCKHNVNALMRGNATQRAAFYNTLQMNGVLSINDVLELEDRNPIEGGDVHFVPVNMQTLGKAIAPPVVAPEPAPAPSPSLAPLRALLAHTLERLGRVEINAARRAAEKPEKLFAWMDDFYPKHAARLADDLAPVLSLAAGAARARSVGEAWCTASRAAILSATECPVSALPGRFESMLAAWEKRPAEVALEVLPCPA